MSNVISLTAPGFRIAASIEATPKQIVECDALSDLFPAGTRVYLTDVGTPFGELAIAARRLTEAGYRPVPHFAARRITSRTELLHRLEVLTGEAGVKDVMVIAGSVKNPAGPYASSLDLLRTGLFDAHQIGQIGVAGHPEGSPDIAPAAVASALAEKNELARNSDADFHIVTQFGFDPDRSIAWAEELRQAGNTLPIHVGVAGPARISTLVKYAAICGVGPSLDFLKKRASSLVALATSHSPEGVVAPLEAHVAANPHVPIRQLHVFPFGGLHKSAEWLFERGSWFRTPQAGSAEFHVFG
jgi:methylenetetrahydrofolate reductase (NADPH)